MAHMTFYALRQQFQNLNYISVLQMKLLHSGLKIILGYNTVIWPSFLFIQQFQDFPHLTYCIPHTKYVRGILWLSRRYVAAAAFLPRPRPRPQTLHRYHDNLKLS